MMQAIVLAGGRGERLKSVVSECPKPMAPVEGRPFLEYLMDYWITQGVTEFILSIGFMADQIMNHFGKNYREARVRYAIEDSPLGTGGALIAAANLYCDKTKNFLALNGDTLFTIDLTDLQNFHNDNQGLCTVALRMEDIAGRYGGIETNHDGRIIKFGKLGEALAGDPKINGGVYLFDPQVLNLLTNYSGKKVSLEEEVFPELLLQGAPLYAVESKGSFLDIGIPKDYANLEAFLKGVV